MHKHCLSRICFGRLWVGLFGLWLQAGLAAEPFFANENTDRCELFRRLNGAQVPAECLAPRPRGLTRGKSRGSIVPPPTAAVAPGPVALDNTYFAYNSSELDAKTRRVLQRIAYVMNHRDSVGLTYRVDGHTDAKGSAAYNYALSERRARAVQQGLIVHGVDAKRLSIVANGFDRLLDPVHRYAAINRRVEITNTKFQDFRGLTP